MAGEPFDVRIPQHFVKSLHTGDITPSMLLTLVLLHNWADWKTGVVRSASAAGLATWSRKAYSVRTFSEALRKLQLMGHITKETVQGSHHDYPIVIHNYKIYDDAGNATIINPKTTKTWAEIETGHCDGGSDETSDEGSDETSDKVLSLNESQIKSQNEVDRWVGGEAGCQPDTQSKGIPEVEAGVVSGEQVPVTEPVPPAKPEVPAREASPARVLAERFFAYQGSPAKLYKHEKDWTRRFGVLLGLYPNLGDIMTFAFETNEFWPQKLIRPASDPLSYFEAKLADPEDKKGSIRNIFTDYQARKAAAKARKPAAPAKPVKTDDEPLFDMLRLIGLRNRSVAEAREYFQKHRKEYEEQHPEWLGEFKFRGICD